MGYLILQMLLSLVVAFAIGFAAAWLIQRSLAERRTKPLRDWVIEAEQVCGRWEAALEQARTVLVGFDREYRFTNARVSESAPDNPTTGRALDGEIVHLERVADAKRPDAGDIADWQKRYEDLDATYADTEQRVAVLKSRLARSRQQNSPVPRMRTDKDTPTISAGARQPTDDLKRVSGIGPVFEQALNEMGIYRFEQLARLTDGDLERVAAELETFPYRLVRDRWVEQARDLAGSSWQA